MSSRASRGESLSMETVMDLLVPTGQFYGVRGSFGINDPKIGGHTTCHTIKFGNRLIIFDTGSGMIDIGNELMKRYLRPGVTIREVDLFLNKYITAKHRIEDLGKALVDNGIISQEEELHVTIIYSHVHMDHLMGIAAFKPIFSPNTHIEFIGGTHDGLTIKEVLQKHVFVHPIFPVKHEWLASKSTYTTIEAGQEFTLDCNVGQSIRVKVLPMNHPNQSYGYQFEWGTHKMAVTLDHEHNHEYDANIVSLWEGADIVITEAQYDEDMYKTRKNFGHITARAAAKHALEAQPKRIITTHHDPDANFPLVEAIARTIQTRSGVPTTYAHQDMTF